MLIVIHQYELCRGVKAKIVFDLTIKYGSMEVSVPLPSRPFICNKDEVIFHPSYRFQSGCKTIEIDYRKIFPPGIKDEEGNVLPCDLDTLMTIIINRDRKKKGYFRVKKDNELESGIEIWRIDSTEEYPCSIERKRKG